MDYYGLLFLYYLKGLSGKSVLRLFFNIEAGGTEEILPNALLNGSVDLGSLDWSYTDGVFFSSESVGKTQTANAQPTIFCIPFVAKPVDYNGAYSGEDKVIWQHPNASLRVRDSAYTSPAEFKSAMQGVTLWYEKEVSTPSTTPILADIQYPDGLRTDQYFTYRKTPTTISNKARIKTIKGNTLVWNQFLNVGTLTAQQGVVQDLTLSNNFNFVANHKYLLSWNQTVTMTSNTRNVPAYYDGENHYGVGGVNNNLEKGIYTWIFTPTNTTSQGRIWLWVHTPSIDVPYTDIMLFDLTLLGIDSLTDAEILQWFAHYFPLNYYSFNSGSLLSFNGNGIKTVGFNQWDEEWEVGGINSSSGQPTTENDRFRSKNFISLLPNVVYYAKIEGLMNNDFRMYYYDANKNFIGVGAWQYSGTFTTPNNAWFGKFVRVNKTTFTKGDICINISDTERNGEYEPYTSSTLSLPISTYFPTGMKSAGSVYDELTESKAITRIGAVDMGTLNGTKEGAGFVLNVPQMKPTTDFTVQKILCSSFEWSNLSKDNMPQNSIRENYQGTSTVFVKTSAYSTLNEFLQAVSGEYLYFELATPTETPITTEDANEALSLLMGRSVSSSNANQLINIITKGE